MFLSISTNLTHNDVTASASHPSDYLPPIAIRWDNGGSRLYIDDQQASELLIDLATVLFDRGTMPMFAAEKVNYLTSSVLMDPREREEAMLLGMGEDF